MSALHALDAARAAGVDVRLDGKDLVLSAASEPPADVIDMVRRHKHSILGLLQQRYIAGAPVPVSAAAVAATGAATGVTVTDISASGDSTASRRPQEDEWSTEDWQARRASGVKDLRLHDLRARGISFLLTKLELPMVAAISGHKDWKVMQRHYARLLPEEIHAAAEKRNVAEKVRHLKLVA